MIHYTTPNYLLPDHGEVPMSFCPFGERIASYILCAVVAFGAVTAIYTLISVYFGA